MLLHEDYLKAAKRHRETCEYLVSKINDSKEYIDVPRQEKIIHNIYYLSGYIIECIVSYTFFEVISYDKTKSVYELDSNNSHGYTFHKYFKEHSNKANDLKIDQIRLRGGNLSSTIPIIGSANVEPIENQMYEEWNARARYSMNHLKFVIDKNSVTKFFNLASNIYTKMKKI
jgi:hypothetical protein